MHHKAIFLDRDGVINKIIMRDGKPTSPRSIEEFVLEDHIQESIEIFKEKSFLIFMVTNQPDISRGLLDPSTLDKMTNKALTSLSINDFRICTHDDLDNCLCRKPKPGMLLELAEKWDINLGESFMIGDTWKDMEAARRANCFSILLERPYNKNVHCSVKTENILTAMEIIERASMCYSTKQG